MVYDDRAIWGVRRKGDSNGKYSLFKKENTPFSDNEESLPDFRKIPRDQIDACIWTRDIPVRTKAMLKSGEHLFLGVMPVDIPEDDPHASYEGRKGGMVWVVTTDDGSKVAEYEMNSAAVWDGMAAVNEHLYISTTDGSVLCLGGE
jgi:hypothetical protein